MLFLGLCFETLVDPFPCSRVNAPPFRDSQRSRGAYLLVELCGSPCPAGVSNGSSLKGGNLSIGLVMCEIDVFAGICNSDGRVEERRPVPVITVVVMSQSAVFAN